MSFPTIKLKVTNLEISPGLTILVDQKFQPLERFLPEGETAVSCEIEMEKLAEHQSGKIYRVEGNLFVAGKMHRSESKEDQIEKAIDMVRNDLKRELRRALGKRHSLLRRGSQAIKNMLRFGE